MRTRLFFCIFLSLNLFACDDSGSKNVNSQLNNVNNHTNNITIDPDCTSVRLTSYTASNGGWCEFDRTLPVLPAFVRDGMTTAIAEPWNGGSYGGDPGESCGECWEIDTIGGSQTVMVHDLCPIEGNPLCAGAHFHFDLSTESAAALDTAGLDEGRARRVPCPVTGNVFAQILDWNQWGFVRLQFVNHRIPIRGAELRYGSEPEDTWHAMSRSGGAWAISGAPAADAGEPIFFRITSAQGEMVGSTLSVPLLDDSTNHYDLGVQLTDQGTPPDGVCQFLPPADVYVDGWGGINQVRWMPNPWGDTDVNETGAACHDDSASCLRVPNMAQWSGMHIYYRQEFPPAFYTTISFRARAEDGPMSFLFSLSGSDGQCAETALELTTEWTRHTIDLATVCPLISTINTITWQNTSAQAPFLLDDVVFE
ncbi:MAG: hypothetical protein CVU65_14015 [Deltaproteobacteria bacterium HGW-Deltaproteobacteria-22]|nr:MAG: hypothetical protein CVU65_14015 [Deltaproteobacteria bacterium HGW-Deltaproteobacteria-22]